MMQKLQDSVFSIVKTTNLSPAVFSFLQPTGENSNKTPQGGILSNTRFGWLALGPKFCVVDLKSGLKVAAHTFGAVLNNLNTVVTCVVELHSSLTHNSQQLVISLECEDSTGMICVFHINGSQILRCIQTEAVVTELDVCDVIPDGPFTCFDGIIVAGTRNGEIFVFDLCRTSLIQALKNVFQANGDQIKNEVNSANLSFLPLDAIEKIEGQRDLVIETDDHIAVLLNEDSLVDDQYIFRNPDTSVRLKAKRDHIIVTTLKYVPQIASFAVGFNFGAFQIWNLMTLRLEFTSQVNVECLPVTHFGFQEPCDDPRAFCYLWVVFSVMDRLDEEEFPLAVMYSLTYQGKRMLSDTKCLYQDFTMATLRFQVELSMAEETQKLVGGRCIACHTYSIDTPLGEEGEENMLNICHLVWECWGENPNSETQYGMLLFDLDQWYKDQMPATHRLENNAFMSCTWCGGDGSLHVRLDHSSVCPYTHATRLEEHFYPNSLQYDVICLTTSESYVLSTMGVQRQIIASMDEVGPAVFLKPEKLYKACVSAGLKPLYHDIYSLTPTQEQQRSFLLSVALEARLSRVLRRCGHAWATHTHAALGCTLSALVDWSWSRALELKENAKELIAPLFVSSTLPDRNVVRCLEHCVQQLSELAGLLDALLTKCCNLLVPDALSEIEERHKCVGTVSLYFSVVQWFLRVGLLPERHALPYPAEHLATLYQKRRVKLCRLEGNASSSEGPDPGCRPCTLLYVDQLIEEEFGGERIRDMWIKGGSEQLGVYPPPSLYALLRVYLLSDIAEEHKHSLVLYLLLDYSMLYDELQYEAVIRRLMQFPTMFGLSNTAIKATQAFWHLDHRNFDFALDQLQCLTGNTLSDWQHNVVLSSLIAQKKTQAALQYLHVRQPAPPQLNKDINTSHVSDHVKLEDWQSYCNLYLARGLVFEALDVIRMCVQNASSTGDKTHLLNYFFKGCRNTAQLAKVLQFTLMPFEEDTFLKYLEDCNDPQTSDILVVYYLQRARYLEAEQYNNKLRSSRSNISRHSSAESVAERAERGDRDAARDALVEAACSALPAVTGRVLACLTDQHHDTHVVAPKPMSVYVQANSHKNTFVYKSSFIQDTITNASETWINKPKMRRGMKRALNIEETPFICTPKLNRNRSIFTTSADDNVCESSPPKRTKLNLTGSARTPKVTSAIKVSENLSRQMETLLHMPDVQSPDTKRYIDRTGADTPQSILKIRNEGTVRDATSPTESRYVDDSEDELLETASNHTHYSDTANKHLRFTIPTESEGESTPSPLEYPYVGSAKEAVKSSPANQLDMDISEDSYITASNHLLESNHFESPSKKHTTENVISSRKSYKDTVRARRSFSISANSSLSDEISTSIESIADIRVTLINPRYFGERQRRLEILKSSTESVGNDTKLNETETKDTSVISSENDVSIVTDDSLDKTDVSFSSYPTKRRGLRTVGPTTPTIIRTRSVTPERPDSPVVAPLRPLRMARSRSRTPEVSPRTSPLPPIPELTRPGHTPTLGVTRSRSRTPEVSPRTSPLPPIPETTQVQTPTLVPTRNRSQTPERKHKVVSPRLESISELVPGSSDLAGTSVHSTDVPTKSEEPSTMLAEPSLPSPSRRNLRSRSRTPERKQKAVVESPRLEAISESPIKSTDSPATSTDSPVKSVDSPSTSPRRRSLRSRSRTPEVGVVVPDDNEMITVQASPRTLRSRSKTPEKLVLLKMDRSAKTKKSLNRLVLEANTFAKNKPNTDLDESETPEQDDSDSKVEDIVCTPMKPSKPASNLMDFTFSPIVNKSVLHSSTESFVKTWEDGTTVDQISTFPDNTMNETNFAKSVLHSCESSEAEVIKSAREDTDKVKTEESEVKDGDSKPSPAYTSMNISWKRSVLNSYLSSTTEFVDQEEGTSITKGNKTQEPLPETSDVSNRSVLRDVSSLITNDSDMDTKEYWQGESEKDKATQKEKEKIVEIEREIHEIEEDMSNESDHDGTSDDEEIIEDAEHSSEESDESSENEDSDSDIDDEIISIADTDSRDSHRSLEKHQIVEDSSDSSKSRKSTQPLDYPTKDIDIEEESSGMKKKMTLTSKSVEVSVVSDSKNNDIKEPRKFEIEERVISEEIRMDSQTKIEFESTNTAELEEATDSINQGYLSILTDDNSVLESDQSNLNQKEDEYVAKTAKAMETDCVDYPDRNSILHDPRVGISKTASEQIKNVEQDHIDTNVGRGVGKPNDNNENSESDDKSQKQHIELNKENFKQIMDTNVDPLEDKNVHNESKRTEKSVNVEKGTPRASKRAISTTSNKSVTEKDKDIEEPRTPMTRKRSKSISNKPTDLEVKTPSRRAKTPTSTEIRKILTRRASRELSESKLEDFQTFDEILSTPRRRSTRTKSDDPDDNAGITSDNSLKSTLTQMSDLSGDVKSGQVRKSRKSLLSAKIDLPVIPEVIVEHSGKGDGDSTLADSTLTSRLTRQRQSTVSPSPSTSRRSRRTPTRSSVPAVPEQCEEESSSPTESRTVGRMTPQREDQLKARSGRAASETKQTPKPAKISRTKSVDLVGEASPVEVASVGRRASFSRACSALRKPRSRRGSTDVATPQKTDAGPSTSLVSEGEAISTPARRTRRASSAQTRSETVVDKK